MQSARPRLRVCRACFVSSCLLRSLFVNEVSEPGRRGAEVSRLLCRWCCHHHRRGAGVALNQVVVEHHVRVSGAVLRAEQNISCPVKTDMHRCLSCGPVGRCWLVLLPPQRSSRVALPTITYLSSICQRSLIIVMIMMLFTFVSANAVIIQGCRVCLLFASAAST